MEVIAIGETMVQFTPEENGLMRHAASFVSHVAGAETTTLIGLARLGHRTGWISNLGEDEFGAQILMTVRGEGIDTSQVNIDASSRTGTFFKEIIREDGVRISYYRDNSAASKLKPHQIEESYLANARYLYITGITPALSKSAKQTIFHAMEIAKKRGVKIVFDPNLRRKLWSEEEARDTLLKVAEMADIVVPGKSEGQFLFGTENPEQIAESFLSLGAGLVVVKLGEDGAYYKSLKEKGYINGFKVPQLVDPVGAGDSFAAGLLSGLLDQLSISKAVERACGMGALTVAVKGDYEGLPDRKRLEQFMDQEKNEDISR